MGENRSNLIAVLGLLVAVGESASAQAPPTEDDEEKAIAAELAAMQASKPETPAPPAPPPRDPIARGNVMNPAISANGLVLGGGATEAERNDGDLTTGLHLQEVEMRFSSIVDPYFRADLTLAIHEDEIGFEEAYMSTLEIPRVTIRAGQMFARLGRHNLFHTHQFPFLNAPLPSRVLLGREGFRDPGVSVEALLPLPFFAELTGQAFAGEWEPFEGGIDDDPATVADESVSDARQPGDLAYLGHLKTLFELGSDSTLEVGGSYVAGRNGFGRRTDVLGGDFTFKWRPLARERYTSFDWSSEYLWVKRRGAPEAERVGGLFSAVRFQFHQRWWVQGRGALLGLPKGDTERTWRGEGLLAFVPSEFSALRLQYAFEAAEEDGIDDVHEVFLQALFSIGPHAPHDY